jgi:hypothetical protein
MELCTQWWDLEILRSLVKDHSIDCYPRHYTSHEKNQGQELTKMKLWFMLDCNIWKIGNNTYNYYNTKNKKNKCNKLSRLLKISVDEVELNT